MPPRSSRLARLTTVLVLVWASGLAAQTSPSPPGDAAAWLVGPVTLYPSIVLRDVGFDSNILNQPDAAKEDFTLTAQPRLRAAVPLGSTLLSGSATVGFVYYATYKEQQSINRLFEGRLESAAGRLRPFLAGALTHSLERSGYEIDPRVLRQNNSITGGSELKLTHLGRVPYLRAGQCESPDRVHFFGRSMRTISEFWCERSNTRCFPSGVTSNVFKKPRSVRSVSCRVLPVERSSSQKSLDSMPGR